MSRRSVALVGVLLILMVAGSTLIGAMSAIGASDTTNGNCNIFLPLIMKPILCGSDPTPPSGASCPPQCDQCVGGTCIIDCVSTDCTGTVINCPNGLACEVNCEFCNDSSVYCPEVYPCNVTCMEGFGGCDQFAVNCSQEGTCSLVCGGNACPFTDIFCQYDACTGECQGAGTCDLNVYCNDSCSCVAP